MADKILISGGTGLVGKEISQLLITNGYEVAYLSRSPKKDQLTQYAWDIKNMSMDSEALKGTKYMIHLAGAGVADLHWSEKRKKEILESRTRSTELLRRQIAQMEVKPEAFVSASAVGYYGANSQDEMMTEGCLRGTGFLADVVEAWERSVDQIADLGIRTVKLRIGIVLSEKGGALEKIAQPIRYGLGAPLGSGDQYMSWIHVRDLARMFHFVLENDNLVDVFNAVGPNPATNAEFTKATADVLDKSLFLPNVPAFVLRIMLGQMSQIVLGGNRVSSQKIEQEGFKFQFPDLPEALADLLGRG